MDACQFCVCKCDRISMLIDDPLMLGYSKHSRLADRWHSSKASSLVSLHTNLYVFAVGGYLQFYPVGGGSFETVQKSLSPYGWMTVHFSSPKDFLLYQTSCWSPQRWATAMGTGSLISPFCVWCVLSRDGFPGTLNDCRGHCQIFPTMITRGGYPHST